MRIAVTTRVVGFVLGFAEPGMVSRAGSVCAREGESFVGFACCGEAVQLDPVGFAEERQPFTSGSADCDTGSFDDFRGIGDDFGRGGEAVEVVGVALALLLRTQERL